MKEIAPGIVIGLIFSLLIIIYDQTKNKNDYLYVHDVCINGQVFSFMADDYVKGVVQVFEYVNGVTRPKICKGK